MVYQNIRGSQLYVHSGGMVDWLYAVQKVYSYTQELRPSNAMGGGFVLPPRFILPTGIENYFGMLDFLDHVLE